MSLNPNAKYYGHKTLPEWPGRVAKSSTPRTLGVLNSESPKAVTRRSSVIRPAPRPSWAASLAPARPANASPTRSSTRSSRVVKRPYGQVSCANGLANVTRTNPRVAHEASDLHQDHDAQLTEREILQSALIEAMHAL